MTARPADQSGTSYSLALADIHRIVECAPNTAAITVTVPTDAAVAFPVGVRIEIPQTGAEQITVQCFTTDDCTLGQGILK